VLAAFAGQRLLVLADDTVEIAHEVLLTAWPLLRDNWLAENRADRIILAGLRATASDWERHEEDPAYLYTGSLLEAATAAAARADDAHGRRQPLIPGEQVFLAASNRARRRRARRLRGLLAVLTALTVALTAGTIVAISQRATADAERATADAERDQAIENQIVAEAELLSATNPSLADQLLLTAYHMDPSRRDLAWRLVSTESQTLSTSENADVGGFVDSVAFSPDGKTLAASGATGLGAGGSPGDGMVTLWSVNTPAGTRQLGQLLTAGNRSSVFFSVAFGPDGKTLAAGGVGGGVVGGTVTLWDVTNPAGTGQPGQLLITTAVNGTGVNSVAFSPHGTVLAAADSGAAQLWNWDVPYAIRRICDLTAAELTPQQWHQYIPQLRYDPPCSSYR